jgi:hypothetical protein
MTTFQVIDAIANTTTVLSALGLLIHVFGDPDNEIWDDKIKAWLAKLGLSTVICGAAANALLFNNPTGAELVLSCGISITFFWLNWWQYGLFKANQKNNRENLKKTKKIGE